MEGSQTKQVPGFIVCDPVSRVPGVAGVGRLRAKSEEIRMGKHISLFIATLLVGTGVAPASAELIAYEGFDFPPGTELQNQAGSSTGIGTIPAHPATDFRFNSNPDNLEYTDGTITLVTGGRAASQDATVSGTMDLHLPLTTPVTAGDLYFSFLVNVEAVTSFGLGWGLVSSITDNNGGLGTTEALVRSTSSVFGNQGDGFDNRSGPAQTTNTLHFVVGRITGIGSGVGNGTMTTWWNPTDLADIENSATTTIASTGGTFTNSIVAVWMGHGGEEDAVWDEIRLGTTLEDVVPVITPFFTLDDVAVEDTPGFSVDTLAGIQYVLERSDAAVTNWSSTGMSVLGDGNTHYLFDPKGFSTSHVYRVTGKVP